jgi:hypothetical protein
VVGPVALMIEHRDFSATTLHRSNWTGPPCQRRKLVSERHGIDTLNGDRAGPVTPEHVGNLQQRKKMESCAQEDLFSYLSMCNIIFLTAKELL